MSNEIYFDVMDAEITDINVWDRSIKIKIVVDRLSGEGENGYYIAELYDEYYDWAKYLEKNKHLLPMCCIFGYSKFHDKHYALMLNNEIADEYYIMLLTYLRTYYKYDVNELIVSGEKVAKWKTQELSDENKDLFKKKVIEFYDKIHNSQPKY